MCGTEKEMGLDYSRWMAKLEDKLQNIPVNKLALPGSHDSGAYIFHRPITRSGKCTI